MLDRAKFSRSCLTCAIAATIFITGVGNLLAEDPNLDALQAIGATLKMNRGVVTELSIDCSNLGDSDYQRIADVKTLKSLSISGKAMADHHLEILTGLTELESMLLNGTQLTDKGYRHFAAFQNLRTLSLFHPSRDCAEFTGSGLSRLAELPKLQRLTFAGATAGDEAFAAVGQLTQLREFRQWHNWESPEAIKHLDGLGQLKSLKMGQRLPGRGRPMTPSLDDATLEVIAGMKSLEEINLQEARLSYAGLAKLKSLPNLKTIKLQWIDVAEADIDQLRSELPGVTIDWEPMLQDEEETLLVKKLKI